MTFSKGIPMLSDIFDFFSKTVSQIHFKLGRGVPWVGLNQVCSNGQGPLIFLFFMNFFVAFYNCLLIIMQVNGDCEVNRVCNVH